MDQFKDVPLIQAAKDLLEMYGSVLREVNGGQPDPAAIVEKHQADIRKLVRAYSKTPLRWLAHLIFGGLLIAILYMNVVNYGWVTGALAMAGLAMMATSITIVAILRRHALTMLADNSEAITKLPDIIRAHPY